jgi:hypothetical protein
MRNKQNECNPMSVTGNSRVTLLSDEDLAKVFNFLDNLTIGKIFDINKIPEHKRDVFVECVKQYINCFNNIEFNNEYNKIKKINTFVI